MCGSLPDGQIESEKDMVNETEVHSGSSRHKTNQCFLIHGGWSTGG